MLYRYRCCFISKRYSKFTKKDKAEIEAMKQMLYIEAVAEEESIIGGHLPSNYHIE